MKDLLLMSFGALVVGAGAYFARDLFTMAVVVREIAGAIAR